MKTTLVIKKGNPIFVDESSQSQALYTALRTRLETLQFDYVWLLSDKLQVSGYNVTRSVKYPKNVSMKWLFDYLDTFGEKVGRADDYKKTMQPVENFLKMARAEIKRGGVAFYDNCDTLVVKNGTFTAKMWGITKMRFAPQADIDRLVRECYEKYPKRVELARLEYYCEINNLK